MQCPVCQATNDEFAVTCIQCHGFLQNRVTNLDLFETVWAVIESPRSAFWRIRLAHHKNYAISLFAFFGIGVVFSVMWMFRLGGLFSSLLELIAVGLGIGLLAGLALAPIAATLYWGMASVVGGKGSFRDSLALIGYSLVPMIVAIIFLLPIELLTFGMYLFTHNPHPSTLKPELYIILIGLDAASVCWTFALLFIGTSVGHQIGKMKSVVVTGIAGSLIIAGLYYVGAAIGAS